QTIVPPSSTADSGANDIRFSVDRLLPAIAIAWLAGVVLLLVRMAGGWWQGRRLHRLAVATSSCRWQSTFRPIAYPARLPCRGRRRRVHARRRADGRRLAAAGDPAAGRRTRLVVAVAGGSDHCARARAHPPARLRGEPAADPGRDPALLSPGGVVAVEPDSHRARALLRRCGDRDLRRSGWLRAGAGGARESPHAVGVDGDGGDRRIASEPRAAHPADAADR